MQAIIIESLIVHCQEIFETGSDLDSEDFKYVFAKEVSIDQAVARAESFKPKTERRILRSISCTRVLQSLDSRETEQRQVFQGRGVTLRRDRSLVGGRSNLNIRNRTEFSDGSDTNKFSDGSDTNKFSEGSDDTNKFSEGSDDTKKSDASHLDEEKTEYDNLCEKHKYFVNNINKPQSKTSSETIPSLQTEKVKKIETRSERSGRSRLRDQLNWFRSKSKQRLSSFGSALSPYKRRSASYKLDHSLGEEGHRSKIQAGQNFNQKEENLRMEKPCFKEQLCSNITKPETEQIQAVADLEKCIEGRSCFDVQTNRLKRSEEICYKEGKLYII